MVNLKINGVAVTVNDGVTVLEACKSAGVNIPTLCYLKDLNEIGACRVCLVEVVGEKRLVASCNTVVTEGMEVLTDTPRVINARKTNVELILSKHNTECAVCVRDGQCQLRKVAVDLGIFDIPYEEKPLKTDLYADFPLIKDYSKCINCMRCVNECENVQSLAVWQVAGSGKRTAVKPYGNVKLKDSRCSLCGQCVTHCPTAALQARDDTAKVFDAIKSDKIVVMQIAPAVRAAWGEAFDLGDGATVGKMCAAAKALGVNYVFDTQFAADLTIMEEGTELIERLVSGGTLPMFTSCCPGWIRFLKAEYPKFVANLSTAKSPQQMFGAVTKTYFAKKLGVKPEDIFCVSVMPCVAKKHECDIKSINASTAKDVDVALTTREFVRMLKKAKVDVCNLAEESFDSVLGESTGAATIFGATGGVMEAALRSAYYLINGKNPDADAFSVVRRNDTYGLREAEVKVSDTISLKVAVVSGLKNTEKLMNDIKSGKAHYDFVEVMACPGGCAGGGGQPITEGEEHSFDRAEKLYALDKESKVRFSHENAEVKTCYDEFFGKPCSHLAHEILHTDHSAWKMPDEK